MKEIRPKFMYLLNMLEEAHSRALPARHGYAGKRAKLVDYLTKLERDSKCLEWLIEQGYQVLKEKAGYTVRTVVESDALFDGRFKDPRDAIDSAMREAK